MPKQFIYETADLFASIGCRFRVMQWTTREQAFDQLLSTSNIPDMKSPANPWDVVLSGSHIQQDYTSFTPWAMHSHEGQYHDSNVPQQQLPRHSVYRADAKFEFNCIGCPSCDFCTKVKKDMLKHKSQHWDPVPCICARQNQRIVAVQLDTGTRQCGRLTIDESARMLRDWEDEQTGQLIHKSGMTEAMPVFTNTTVIQMQRDVTCPNVEQYLNINSQTWH
jgi:hypothetical protein